MNADIYTKQLNEMREVMTQIQEIYYPEFFKESEFYDIQKMNSFLLFILDKLRGAFALKYHGVSFNINYSNGPSYLVKHSENSKHYTDDAVDFWIRAFYDESRLKPLRYSEIALSLEMLLKVTTIWNDIGIGFYPEWNRPGFHIDWSPKNHRDWQAKYELQDGSIKQVYTAVNKALW